MNFTRISSRIRTSSITDPYALLQNYRRSFKVLKGLKGKGSPVLVLGNKNQIGIEWSNHFPGLDLKENVFEAGCLSAVTKSYHLILCLDPVLYLKSLQNLNLPVMVIVRAAELLDHPEIAHVADYILPLPENRTELALKNLVMEESKL